MAFNMEFIRILAVVVGLSTKILQSHSKCDTWGNCDYDCGGFCILEGPCRLGPSFQACFDAKFNCCKPRGNGIWTGPTVPPALMPTDPPTPPPQPPSPNSGNNNGASASDEEESDGLEIWQIALIVVGSVVGVALIVGVGICFCLYFNGLKRNRRVNPAGTTPTAAYGYPGTGAHPGLYQPAPQTQAQFTHDSPFYA